MFGRSTTDTEIYEEPYDPKNRWKGYDFHIGSRNVRSISDQSKAKAFDILAVNSGCKRRTCLLDSQRLTQKSGGKEEGVRPYHHGEVRVSWISTPRHQCIINCEDFKAVVGCSSDFLSWETKNVIDFILTNRQEIAVDCEGYCDYLNCSGHRLLRARFRSTAKKEKSRKFVKPKRLHCERSWDPASFKETINEILTENPQTSYEELTESIKRAARIATLATHQFSRISEETRKRIMSRFQVIHSGQTKDVDLAAINKEVRRSLKSNSEKWREFKSRSFGEKKNFEENKTGTGTQGNPVHEFRIYARYTNPDEPEILQHEVEHAIVTSKTNISPGPDQVTMLQLKLGVESIAFHLTTSLNQTHANGRTPEDWKTVKISLLPKTTKPKKVKGDQHDHAVILRKDGPTTSVNRSKSTTTMRPYTACWRLRF
uniref:Uncharacterized protein n=1 Tax=Caenorhabditis japonica TaxID=281687 RepID=A0A8R1IDG1_CAEJA